MEGRVAGHGRSRAAPGRPRRPVRMASRRRGQTGVALNGVVVMAWWSRNLLRYDYRDAKAISISLRLLWLEMATLLHRVHGSRHPAFCPLMTRGRRLFAVTRLRS